MITPAFSDDSLTVYQGDCLDVLRALPDESVNCCVTSPPYWGLRDYQTAKWEGGDPACNHSVGNQVQDGKAPGAIISGVRPREIVEIAFWNDEALSKVRANLRQLRETKQMEVSNV